MYEQPITFWYYFGYVLGEYWKNHTQNQKTVYVPKHSISFKSVRRTMRSVNRNS